MQRAEKSAFTAYLVLSLGCLALMLSVYLRSCPAILVLDLQESFSAGSTDIALFSSATLFAYGLMQMPSGIITDAIGARKTLTIFLALAAASTLAFALAPTLGFGISARFIKGLTLTVMPPIVALLAAYFPPSRYTQAVSLVMGLASLGTLLAAEPLARLSIALGWRGALVLSAAAVFALALAIFFLIKSDRPLKPGEVPVKRKPTLAPAEAFKSIGHNMRRIFKNSSFWYLSLWQMCTASTMFAFTTMWAGPYLMEAYSLTKLEASRIMLLQGIGAIMLVPIIGIIADRINSRKGVIVAASALGLIGTCGMSFYAGSLSKPMLIFCTTCLSVCSTSGATCLYALIGRNFPKNMTGTGVGCVSMIWPLVAAGLSVAFGVILEARLASGALSGQEATADAYGFAMLTFVGLWVGALILSVFFIKENFQIKD